MTARLTGLTIVSFLALAAPAQAAGRICHGQYAKPVLPLTQQQRELRRYAGTRASYGLRHDTAYVQQLIARRQWASRFDMPATPAEDRYITQRDRLTLGAAGVRYLNRHLDVSIGVSIEGDWPRRPYLLVGFTRDVKANLAALRRVARFPRQLRAKKVRFSVRDLLLISDRISKDEQALRRAGFDLRDVMALPGHNRVELDVITRRGDYRAYFAERYGPAAYVRERKRTATVTECTSATTYSVSADGRTLTLHLPTNGQEKKADHVELAEFPDRVVVGSVERAPAFPLPSRDHEREISVKLAGPLGSRQVIDAGSLRRVRLKGPNPGDPPCPPVHIPSQFEDVTQQRQEAGLPSDPASVQHHIDNNGQLTPDEQRWADQQPNIEPTGAVARYLNVHRDENAGYVRVGVFPEPRRIVYRFSGHAAEHQAALKRLVRRPELMSTETVPYTQLQVHAIFDRLRRDDVMNNGFFDGYGRAGFFVRTIAPDFDDGVVELEVVGVRADAAPYFATAYGPLVRVEVVGDRYECAEHY